MNGPRIKGNREIEAGIFTSMEFAIRFTKWAESVGDKLAPKLIQRQWGCSRATSYRYFNAFRDACGRGML